MADYSEAFIVIVDLARATGAKSIKDLPGCWEYAIGPWEIAVNGHREPVRCSYGVTVDPFHAYVEHDRMPALSLSPDAGVFVGIAGRGENTEDAFIAAVRAEIERVGAPGREGGER